MTLTQDYQRDWPAYFDAVANQPPRDTLVRALSLMQDRPGAIAIDLACGEGRDTRAMLAALPSIHVHAIDNSQDALSRLSARLSVIEKPRVAMHKEALELIPWEAGDLPARADLINASFALPFCHEDHFPALWAWIVKILSPGGFFAGQLFGDRDEWATVNPRRHFTREHTLTLLEPFHLEHFEEVDKNGSDALMNTKHHHLFHIVARKR